MRALSRGLQTACCVAMLLGLSSRGGPALAVEVGGGGGKTTDCMATFVAEANAPAAKPRHVFCTDGDPACDTDMAVNGRCAVDLSVCANSTFSSACTLNGVGEIVVDHAEDDGIDPKFDPDFQALQNRIEMQLDLNDDPGMQPADQCTTAVTIGVALKGPFGTKCRPGIKKVKVRSLSKPISGKVFKDTDVIKIKCIPSPSPNGCDAHQFYDEDAPDDGTFKRIQKQVFNQSCALSTCHDSEGQNQANSLLLETGAAYTNLVNVAPVNGAAFVAGWKRVDAPMVGDSGNPATSLLYQKVVGGLGEGYGARMPLKRPKLHKSLIEIIRLWIAAGAPETGWVDGTD